ncbi:MAG: PPC domain-containing protein [Paludibacteraceae bacterium]|nr:PPC domain-containing protein [Paludibacteraceae bacterium]
MRKIFTLFAAFAVAFSATAAKSNSLLQGIVFDPQIDLSNNTLPSFTPVTLPYSGTVSWNPTGSVIVPDFDYGTYNAMGFTFTVAEGRGVNIAFSGANVACVLSSSQVLTGESQIKVLTPKSSMPIKLELMAVATPANANWTSEALSAGTYTLFVVYYGSDTPSFLLSVQDADPVQLKSYTEIDYSAELKPGKKVYGMLGDGEGELLDPASLDGAPFTPYAKGYTIEVEQGKFYSLHFENYSNNYYDYRMRVDYNRMFAYVLTGDDLSGDFLYTDMLVSDEDILNDGFVAPVSGKVRLLLMLPQDAKSVVYTMELEEDEITVCDAISLEELFDNATPVTYTSDLIYADAGTLSCSEAFLVEGFIDGDSEKEKFCRAYKVSLKANDKLYIYNHTSNDAYLYLYALEEGDPTQVKYSDDDGYDFTGIDHDSYIEFTAKTAGDYYIVPTTYSGSSVEDFFVVISAVSPEDLDLEITALNASAKSIYVEDVDNKGEILVKLSELKITGTVLGANLLLDNSVDSWLLSADRTTATYIANDEMYAFADDVEPLVITIVPGSGINDVEGDANLSVYAANGVINILGTQGGEDVAVYNVMGSKIAAVKATAEITTVNIPCAGVYVVRVGNKSFKVIGQ